METAEKRIHDITERLGHKPYFKFAKIAVPELFNDESPDQISDERVVEMILLKRLLYAKENKMTDELFKQVDGMIKGYERCGVDLDDWIRYALLDISMKWTPICNRCLFMQENTHYCMSIDHLVNPNCVLDELCFCERDKNLQKKYINEIKSIENMP